MIVDRSETRTFPRFLKPATIGGVISWIVSLDKRYRERQALRTMTDHQLNDIGLTRENVETVANAPVWDAPIQFR